ncbi:MAG TPA: hypothetical protein VN638_12225, partial [Nitrospiraceae bacterium]|nr:hypothetical protein [Nitrospiraceae bacterium]
MMRGKVLQITRRRRSKIFALILQSVLLAGSLVVTPGLFAAGIGEEFHQGHASPVSMPVHAQAGPLLQDKMLKAIEQIEREVKTKGLFQGAGAHAMQQGVLLVAEDKDKVK